MPQATYQNLSKIGLATSEAVFEVLARIPSPLALVGSDNEFRVLYVNHAFTALFGYAQEEVKTVSDWSNLVYLDEQTRKDRSSSWQMAVESAIQNNSAVPVRESRVRCKNGSFREVILQTAVLRNLLLVTFVDVTERKALETRVIESERKFRSFVENANDIIYTLDLAGHFTYVSPNCHTILGLSPAELVGRPFSEILHPDDLPASFVSYATVLQGSQVDSVEYRVRHPDGRWLWQSSNLAPILDETGAISAVIGVGRDIHLRKDAQEKQKLSEARYRLISDHARDVIWTMDPDGKLTYVSPSVLQTRGYIPEEVINQSLEQIHSQKSINLNLQYFKELREDIADKRKLRQFRGEMEYLCKDGSTYWCEVMITPIQSEDGALIELLGVSRDISEYKRYQNELERAKEATESLNRALQAANEQLSLLATTDALTSLWNRRFFEERLTGELSVADQGHHPLSLILFDIDYFKAVNDRYGHINGDRVLVEFARLTRKGVRTTDLPCRWGGEEFMVLLPLTGASEAMAIAERLRISFGQCEIPGIEKVTASFGVACRRPLETLDSLVIRTDAALYEAKSAGRNTVRMAS